MRRSRLWPVLPALIISAMSAAVFVRPAGADVTVIGDPEAVELDAQDASVEDALNALRASFGVRHRSWVALTQTVSGSYRGSLRHVIAKLLDRYDYVTKASAGAVEVVVFSAHPGVAVGAHAYKAPPLATKRPIEVEKPSAAAARPTTLAAPPVMSAAPSQAPGPVVAPWPPPPPPNQNPVVGMLDSVARSQIPPSGGAVPGTVPQTGETPMPASPPAPADIAQTVRNAASALDSLRNALARLPK
jgi:hypothetical protein